MCVSVDDDVLLPRPALSAPFAHFALCVLCPRRKTLARKEVPKLASKKPPESFAPLFAPPRAFVCVALAAPISARILGAQWPAAGAP